VRSPARAGAPQAAAVRRTAAPLLTGVAVAATVAFALLLRWPGLAGPLHTDDYVQDAMLAGTFPAPRSAFALYDFGGRTAQDAERLRAFGWFPWWSAPDLKLAMFRPLSSASIALDHALFGGAAWPRRAHAAALAAALLLAAWAVLRLLLPPAVAWLALLVLAADPALSIPLAWLPNRNALAACALGIFGLYAYLRYRRGGGAGFALAAALSLGSSALAGEYALPLCAYVLAYEWLVASDALASRARSAAIVLAPVAAVVVLGAALGYGTRGSGLYVSPLVDPARYISAAYERLPVLAGELLCGLPPALADTWAERTGGALPASLLRLCAVALVLGLLWRAARWTGAAGSHALRFFAAASLLGLPLLAGAVPEARLLLPLSLGAAGAAAVSLHALAAKALDARAIPAARAGAAALALVVATVFLGVKPVRAHGAAAWLRARADAHTAWALRAAVDDTRARDQEWIVIAARDFTTLQILPFVRAFHGKELPRAYRVLSVAPRAHLLTRLDAHAFELRVIGGRLDDLFAGSLHRPRTQPFSAGIGLAMPGLQVHVDAVERGQPARMRFVFPEPLDAGRYAFLYPEATGLQRLTLPSEGEALRLLPPRAPRLPP
jgi:hypothetical protein